MNLHAYETQSYLDLTPGNHTFFSPVLQASCDVPTIEQINSMFRAGTITSELIIVGVVERVNFNDNFKAKIDSRT